MKTCSGQTITSLEKFERVNSKEFNSALQAAKRT
jgi:hypothetical protein